MTGKFFALKDGNPQKAKGNVGRGEKKPGGWERVRGG